MRRFLRPIFFLLVLLAILAPAAMSAPPEKTRYIVVLHDDGTSPGATSREIARQNGGRVGFIYEHAIKGFSIQIPEQALSGLERNPHVRYVATDDVRHAFAQTLPTGIRRVFAHDNTYIGLDGIDDWRVDVDVAVIDSGIDFQHPDLNVAGGVNCTGNLFFPTCVSGGDDDHYHGTHVAGTIGALDNGVGVAGVAPGARLWAVKVLDKNGSGYASWVVAGIDWITKNAAIIEVANISLGGNGFNQAEYDAIQGAVNKGVAFAVAAGNNDADAGYYTPAGFDNVLTVSALADFDGAPGGLGSPTCRIDKDDTLADFSNWGSAVDVAAPGVCIRSTVPIEKGSYATLSGTSMASPHAAGALALLASRNNPNDARAVYTLYDQVKNNGNSNWSDDSGDGTKEPLLDVGNTTTFNPVLIAGSAGGGTNTSPTVSISSPTNNASFPSGARIAFSGAASDTQDGNLTASLVWTSSLDGPIGTGATYSATLSAGTHTVTASVTDSGGLTGSARITVAVEAADGVTMTLSVRAYKIKNGKYSDLTWAGATSATVDVYRNSGKIATTSNVGQYLDGPLDKTVKSATYKVCEQGSTTCSNAVGVSW